MQYIILYCKQYNFLYIFATPYLYIAVAQAFSALEFASCACFDQKCILFKLKIDSF